MVEVSPTAPVRAMELITILNRCHCFRGFVYQQAHFSADKKSIEVAVRPRKGSAAVCSRCHLPAPGHKFVPFRQELNFGSGSLPCSLQEASSRRVPLPVSLGSAACQARLTASLAEP